MALVYVRRAARFDTDIDTDIVCMCVLRQVMSSWVMNKQQVDELL